jgi:aromatic ring hydroxylase
LKWRTSHDGAQDRRGAHQIAQDSRTVFIDGKRVADVTEHPAFRNSVRSAEFGSRHTQYEMFYAGAQFVTRSHSFRTFDWNGATGLVDKLMSTYDLGGELDAGH